MKHLIQWCQTSSPYSGWDSLCSYWERYKKEYNIMKMFQGYFSSFLFEICLIEMKKKSPQVHIDIEKLKLTNSEDRDKMAPWDDLKSYQTKRCNRNKRDKYKSPNTFMLVLKESILSIILEGNSFSFLPSPDILMEKINLTTQMAILLFFLS